MPAQAQAEADAGPSNIVLSWDDQVVPALRRRLESESAYLTRRMSSTSFPSVHGDESLYNEASYLGSGPGPAMVSQRDTSGGSSQYRTRTKSSGAGLRPGVGTSSGPMSHQDRAEVGHNPYGSSYTNTNTSYDYYHEQSRSQAGVVVPHSAPRPSRIPTRPRSKSNLGARPDPPLPPTEQVPTMPSPYRRPSVRRDDSRTSSNRGGREEGQGRYSPELAIERGLGNDDLRNQLPPFRMTPDEAMRIAERGHDLRERERDRAPWKDGVREEDGGEDEEYYMRREEVSDPKRKRRQTMRTTSKPSVSIDDQAPDLPSSGTGSGSGSLPRSATATLGLGLPASRSRIQQSTSRSTSSQPANHLSASGSTVSSSTTPRSASLNMLAQSGLRLGIAAHLVPPESTYTPPKGQSWDEVVLPTVAKKLGLGDSPSPGQGGWSGGEGDLAVEWDKNGVPVKWIKRESVNRLGGPGEASRMMKDRGLQKDDFITSHDSSTLHPLGSSTKSAFSPSFEPSPDNPLNPSRLLPRNSYNSLTPSPSPTPRHQRSNEQLQPHPIRTSSGQWTSLGQSPPSSSAPFSQMHRLGQKPSFDNSNYNTSASAQGSPVRKQSTLRKNTTTPQRSADNLKNGDMYFTNPRPTRVHPQQGGAGQGEGVYDGRRTYSQHGQLEQSAWSPASGTSQRDEDGREGGKHGKGCGCLIM